MRFLCNENVPHSIVLALENDSHDVAWVRRSRPGISDQLVLDWAAGEQRICVTFDKDFGELAASGLASRTSGIILLRIPAPATIQGGMRIARLLGSRTDWSGHFSVIEPGRIRQRPMAKTL